MAERPASGPLDEIMGEVIGVGSKCSVAPFLAALSAERQDAIASALAQKVPKEAIGRTVRKWGFPGTTGTVVRHLSGRCSCRH